MPNLEPCNRHFDRPGHWGITTHYLNGPSWRDVVDVEQKFGPLCAECRLEFIHWISTRAES